MHDHGGWRTPARPPRPSRRWRWPYLAGLVGAVLAVAVAACGGGGGKTGGVASLRGSDKPTATTAAGGSSDPMQGALVFVRCMRQHGYDMPDPQMEGNNVLLQLPNYQGQRAPKYQAAWQACRRYAPNGGQPQRPSAQDRQQALVFARCMRQHGITNMPDPQITADGIDQQSPPGMRRDDPRFTAAEQACAQRGGGGK